MAKLTPAEYIALNNKLKKLAMNDVASFICFNNNNYHKPKHLQPIIDCYNAMLFKKEVKQIAFSVPPQHYKSVTTLNHIALNMLINPHRVNAYAGYSIKFSRDQMRIATRIYKKFKPDFKAIEDTATSFILEEGGGIFATSKDSIMTGYAIDDLYIDDPIANRAKAESRLERESVWDWWNSTAKTRIRPNKTNVVVVHTRWHEDDFIGRLKKYESDKFQFINIKGISDDNKPLLHSLEFYEDHKLKSPYNFHSLYQGDPRPKEGRLFRDVNYTDKMPTNYKIGIGIDLAYTQKTNADYSCYVVTMFDLDTQKYVVVEADHWQTEINESIIKLQRLQSKYPNSRIVVEKNGTQKAIYDMLLRSGLKVQGIEPRGDKYTRVLDVSSKWNTNNVLVLNSNSVKPLFIEQICDFTGINDLHDDYIDALNYSFTNIKNPNSTGFAIL
jgi:predicted phage terminase large subunit-like protein